MLGQGASMLAIGYGETAASLTRAASERTPSLRMRRALCTLIVFSTVPRWPAICLLRRPATMCPSTSRSRGVSAASRLAIALLTALTRYGGARSRVELDLSGLLSREHIAEASHRR